MPTTPNTPNLVFTAALNKTHPVNLVFGADDAHPAVNVHAALAAVMPAPVLSARTHYAPVHKATVATTMPVPVLSTRVHYGPAHKATVAFTMPAPVMSASMGHDNAVFRGPNGRSVADWQLATKVAARSETKHQQGTPHPAGVEHCTQSAKVQHARSTFEMQNAIRKHQGKSTRWHRGVSAGAARSALYQSMIRRRSQNLEMWREAIAAGTDRHGGWQDRYRRPRPTLGTRWQPAAPLEMERSSQMSTAVPKQLGWQDRWQEHAHPKPGRFELPPEPPFDGYAPDADLLFEDPLNHKTYLLFRRGRHPVKPIVLVPVRRTYIVINDVHLKRVDGNIELPTYSMNLKIDWDSWTWGFDAALPAHLLPSLQRTDPKAPVELEATVNGKQYRLLAEDIKRTRTFGRASLAVSGRGRSAVLADPISPILAFSNSQARTARQLMEDALRTNGVSIGWAVDWRIEDWLVPAGAWNHSGSYMSAVTAIAEAAGAFIQPDPNAQILRVRPRYSQAPWEWDTVIPELELPSSVVTVEGVRWLDKADYNAVYVSGSNIGGVLGYVKRTGSAGDKVAPMVTDQLITDAIAARLRGTRVLSDTGAIAEYSLSLPVLPETGIIEPGTMIRYVDGNPVTGVVKGVSVQSNFPSVRQTIEVETHA